MTAAYCTLDIYSLKSHSIRHSRQLSKPSHMRPPFCIACTHENVQFYSYWREKDPLHLSMLVVVAYEFPQLLLSALQCCVKLLHLIHNVCLLHSQTLAVRFHSCNTQGGHTRWREKSGNLNGKLHSSHRTRQMKRTRRLCLDMAADGH